VTFQKLSRGIPVWQEISERSAALRSREQSFAERDKRVVDAEASLVAARREVESRQRSADDTQAEVCPPLFFSPEGPVLPSLR